MPKPLFGGQTTLPGCPTTLGIEAGGSTTSPGGQTTPRTKAGGQTTLPGSQTTHRTEAGCSTATPGGQTAHPHVAPSSLASPASAVPTAPPVPSAAPTSTTPPAPHAALASQHFSCHPRAMQELPAPALHQQSPLVKAVPVAPSINPHPITTRANQSFRLPPNKLTLLATSSSPLSPVPTSIRAALADLS
jgi:hypothetical protein